MIIKNQWGARDQIKLLLGILCATHFFVSIVSSGFTQNWGIQVKFSNNRLIQFTTTLRTTLANAIHGYHGNGSDKNVLTMAQPTEDKVQEKKCPISMHLKTTEGLRSPT